MTVPLDYSKSNGETITLGMACLKSTSNGTAPLGTLLLNSGGIGGAASALIITVAEGLQVFTDEMMADLISSAWIPGV